MLLLLLLAVPSVARADLVYRCETVDSRDPVTVSLRLAENGKSGEIDVQYWGSYPPSSLAYADFGSPRREANQWIYESETDRYSGRSAVLRTEQSILESDAFQARLGLVRAGKASLKPVKCSRL
jgi:hypothetical protein